ncbi:integrin beta-PS-like isoform X1 [Colias croceus]|uniref:integrin beta-PS-like isoform X1 n=2 Tax=Colias crocea TaxID=72248 RepID=UPI001E2812B6|nr:integrin beta-PS-like isoform X1 [Colias croceus]
MNMLFILIIFVIKKSYSLDVCESQKTCEECIKQSYDCIWCSMDNITDRCKSNTADLNSWCLDLTHRISPLNSRTIEQNLNFSSDIGHIIQMKPQKIKMDLRLGHPLPFDFSFKSASDYPVDLYFLMDGSISMKLIKEKTAYQSENIYNMMKTITKNVFLGMGTFVDKNALPFTKTKNSTLTYSFKNHLKLIDNFEVFRKIVNDTPFGMNHDEQEGTLDALAQVIVCKKEIGWRSESRKIIVVLTGGPLHAAGDGQWAGIIKPNDGKCYTENGVYTKELEMDYPSIGLINKLASDEQMTIIFAVTKDMYNLYKDLSDNISGSRITTYDNEIVNILRSIYEDITSNLKININMKRMYRNMLKITTEPDCITTNNDRQCVVKQNQEKKINATIELLQYDNNITKMSIDIVVEGIKEKLNLDINLISTCNCESEENSKMCTYNGKKRCGICECNGGNWGDKCQCSSSNSTSFYDKTICKAPNSTDDCSGHGICKCGTCVCRNRFEGRYCECNKDSCPRGDNNALCSDQGDCNCGKCKCNQGWTGDACNCATSSARCSTGDTICNERGKCICGKCDCNPIAEWDARSEQDIRCVVQPCDNNQDSCHNSQCNILESCAICSRETENSTKCAECFDFNVTVVKNITDENSWAICLDVPVIVGCEMKFGYRYAANRYGIDIIVQSDINCAKSYYMFGGGVLAAILAIGIGTICLWKCISDARDKREYERFLSEVNNPSSAVKCEDNPVFASASMTYRNPAFRKKSLF